MNKNTDDIYSKIDIKIVSHGFWNVDFNKKKQLICEEMFHFTIDKAQAYNVKTQLTDRQKSDQLVSLLYDIDRCLTTPAEKHEFFRHYTHYLLKIMGALQNHEMIWWQEEDKTLINGPSIEVNERKQWSSLTTHHDTDPLKTTLFVFDAFQNNFGINKEQHLEKKRIKRKL